MIVLKAHTLKTFPARSCLILVLIPSVNMAEEKPVDYRKEEKHHKNLEHVGELGTAGAGAFAMV